MKMFVESMKRLYESGRITSKQIAERVESGKITIEEYEYIVGESG